MLDILEDDQGQTKNIHCIFEFCEKVLANELNKRTHALPFDKARVLIKELLQAVDVLHGKMIMHRDIKPESLVFDDKGYLKLTDFGIAREWMPEIDNSNETSGTPGYMAPEVMCKNNHGIAADYFAIGVIAWECMNGRRPYQGKSRREIRDAILAK